jgi:hypothetical protein
MNKLLIETLKTNSTAIRGRKAHVHHQKLSDLLRSTRLTSLGPGDHVIKQAVDLFLTKVGSSIARAACVLQYRTPGSQHVATLDGVIKDHVQSSVVIGLPTGAHLFAHLLCSPVTEAAVDLLRDAIDVVAAGKWHQVTGDRCLVVIGTATLGCSLPLN